MTSGATVLRVSPEEAARLIEHEGYVYLDVRTPQEVELGHPLARLGISLK